jgi:hypothetical protein
MNTLMQGNLQSQPPGASIACLGSQQAKAAQCFDQAWLEVPTPYPTATCYIALPVFILIFSSQCARAQGVAVVNKPSQGKEQQQDPQVPP